MPCYTVQTANIELGKVDASLLAAAMVALGLSAYSYANGVLTIQGRAASSDLVSQVKRSYSEQVVMSQAKRYGWQVSKVGAGQFQVTKQTLGGQYGK